ncbi:3,4-dihydroxy-2-butanone 4-phosphate synthase [Methanimicrococcus sp. At1]|uniref:3,4-dihydroxy-2-butanone 4-phosphate synthase n=1 Tax=Methanimicrococcus hacksteinii TaxID=3028293 RepID=A0ABU3VNR7_9EURY|nr:3,4-dihydroxy-2-butanone-4-phosphate synthase [Methanimicrococcus sp. At1]MDV0445050.1 3,4-dihydroxy-2-butanone 4-phosphate synthase [Methanimicrococcus sp. At1]
MDNKTQNQNQNQNDSQYSEKIQKTLQAIRDGKFFLLYDSEKREGETDFVIAATAVQPQDVKRMRKDGGGLICVAVSPKASEIMKLPFMADVVTAAATNDKISPKLEIGTFVEKEGDIQYDKKSSFSLWVNHRENRTGIPDDDRAFTIRRLGEMTKTALEGKPVDFASEFRTPGHTATLRASKGLLDERRGQTELSVALALMAGTTPAMVVCEMLDDTNGKALSKEDAKVYGEKNDMIFVEGWEVVEAFEIWKKEGIEA